jgi:aminopeptidase
MQEAKLTEYARLIIRIGVNLQKGQTVVLSCPVECAPFARLLAKEAYSAGAREVVLRWNDDQLTRMKYLHGDSAIFDEVPAWFKTFHLEYAVKKAALIAVASSDPENLKGVDPDRVQRSTIATGRELKDYRDMQMRSDFPWCVVSAPSAAWAMKVFPGSSEEAAIEKLWDAIFDATRVSGDGNAVKRWTEHGASLKRRVDILRNHNFAKLIYKNKLGTDLTVELPEKHTWYGGGEIKNGLTYIANIPTEEIFTLPKKNGVNGTICSSIPLSLDGNLIKDIKFTVKDGKIINATASEGLETLIKKLDVDEGARYFGEVALVPHKSPISDTGILFYNTLFDENASCHFAFGKGYPAFADAETVPEAELAARGKNDSCIHVDFMIGTPDLAITGVTHDGKQIPVFVDGNFAF